VLRNRLADSGDPVLGALGQLLADGRYAERVGHGLDARTDVTSTAVAGADFTGKKVPLVTFTAKGLKATKGLVKVTEAPAKLTAQGVKAFGGMYQAGTDMDPVSLAVALTDDAKLPALPDLGTAPTPSETPEVQSAQPSVSAEPVANNSGGGNGTSAALPISLAAGAVLLVAAAVSVLVVRRRRTSPAAAEATASETD
jgi:hypothetical protein